jgi:glycosyltransferase involved in cell wall biosynthesis
MKFSIITSTYNAAKSLQKCLNSVSKQTLAEIEHIIIDGASTDGSLSIIQQAANQAHTRISWWHSEPDNGIYNAWNKAIPHCKGEWVYFLGADDTLFAPNTLEQVWDILHNHPHPQSYFACGTVKAVYPDGQFFGTFGGAWEVVGKQFLQSGIFGPLLPHQGLFHHRSCFSELGLFNEEFKIAGDSEYIVRMVQAKPHAITLPVTIATFEMGGASGTIKTALQSWKENIRIYKQFTFPQSFWARCKIILWFRFKIILFSKPFQQVGIFLANAFHKFKGKRSFW